MKLKLSTTQTSIVLGLILLLGIGSFIYVQKAQFRGGPGQPQGWGQRPGGAENFGGPPASRPRWSGPIPTPPKYEITYYKGLWAGPWFYPDEYTGQTLEPEKYKTWGVNIVMLQPGFEINRHGEVRYPPDFPTYEDLDARIGELATKFYQANVHVGITLILTYKEEFSEGQKGEKWAGEPQPFPKEIVEKLGYLDKFNKVVEDMAKIAQKYHVEMFSPMGEPDGIFGMNVAPTWIREMIPLVKKHYKGKLYYKGDLHKGQGDQMSFKGYDVLGIVNSPVSPRTPLEETRTSYISDIVRGLAWAKRDGVPEVVISEFGHLSDTEMETPERIGLVLEEANKRLQGVFISEPVPAVRNTIQGKQIYDQMKKWFLSK